MTSEIESNFLFQGTRQPWILATRVAVAGNRILESSPQGRDPFNQNFRNISVQNSGSVRSNRKSFEKTGPPF